MNLSAPIRVSMADFKVAKAPSQLITTGLGSCVGVALYDPVAKVAGLAHIMLPDSRQGLPSSKPGKFADTAIPALIAEMEKAGAVKSRLTAKIVGGAQMFNFLENNSVGSIGDRNVEAVVRILNELAIPILAQDTKGRRGRTITFDPNSGVLSVRTVDSGVKEL
ncbi:MAG: chemotaxis protein CheD [Firmicutes bacterium]|jgi:chemotaxis protein CheD|nr:chemotaxis protein CheD [Bacillota bacterium]HOB21925.1 chemotaxis protein CheD [Bacillota bacterium]HQD40229.1 chemotaxis protein CheD [Bacillota bacterium]